MGGGNFSDFFSSIFGDLMGGGKAKSGFNFGDFGGFGQNTGFSNTGSTSKKSKSKQQQINLDVTKEIIVNAEDLMKGIKDVKIGNMEKCTCDGHGYCPNCGGTGFVNFSKSVKVNLPKGIKNGQKIRLANEGKSDAYGNTGNLLLVVKIQDENYEIDGYDVTTEVTITPAQAVMGFKKNIKTLHGQIGIKIPEMAKNGLTMRLKGLGLPKNSNEFGNLNVKIRINIPEQISDIAKKLYSELLNLGE